jgi:hypothetical protein
MLSKNFFLSKRIKLFFFEPIIGADSIMKQKLSFDAMPKGNYGFYLGLDVCKRKRI